MKRGEIYYCDMGSAIGSEQGGVRPIMIIQNDVGNAHSNTTIVVPMTTRTNKSKLPTHFYMTDKEHNLRGHFMFEQMKTIDKSRIVGEPITIVDGSLFEKHIKISLGVL